MKKKGISLLITLLLLLSVVAPVSGASLEVKARPRAGDADNYEILLNDLVTMRYRSIPSYSAVARSRIIVDRLQKLAAEGYLAAEYVKPGKINGEAVVLVHNQLLATVTSVDTTANNSTADGLVAVWAQNIRQALAGFTAAKGNAPQPNGNIAAPAAPAAPADAGSYTGLTADEQQMLSLVNAEREAAGLAPLQADPELVRLARMKSKDMIANNYFAHQSPTYGSPFDMMKNAGVKYSYAGENLAGAPSVQSAHNNLMASPGHRANILNSNFTRVGIGIVDGGRYGKMFTQMFIRQ